MRSIAVAGAEQRSVPSGSQTDTSSVPSVGDVREGRLAEVIPLAHARSSAELSSHEVTPSSAELRDFASIIEPLERRQRRRLIEPGLSQCRAAFASHPNGFALIAARSLREGRLPLSFLIRLVRDREHEIASEIDEAPRPTAAAVQADPVDGERRQEPCFVCGEVADATLRFGVWWCDRHLVETP